MIRQSALIIPFLSIALFTACSDRDSGGKPYYGDSSIANIEDVLARMPARSMERGEQVFAALVRLGPRNIRRICDRLVPPGSGDDTRERLALSGLAKYVTRPGAESERKMVTGAFVDALRSAEDVEVASFLIRQLQLAGKDEAVVPLSRYLSEERLCDPAAQALVTIGSPEAERAFLEALPEVGGSGRIVLIQALGQLRSQAAVETLLGHAAADDPDTRQVALWALANIGDPAAADVLAEAARIDTAFKGAQAVSNYVLFAQRLAEEGHDAQGATICRELLSRPVEHNASAAALTTLVSILGDEALDDLLNAADTGDVQLQGVALALADHIPGRRATGQWIARLEQATPEKRAKIVTMLGRRNDSEALRAVRKALEDADPGVRLAAIPALDRLAGDAAADDFVKALQTADQPAEATALKEALLRLPGRTTITAVTRALSGAPTAVRIIFLEVLGEVGSEDQLETVYGYTGARDESVRLAAVDALGHLGGEDDMPRLLDLVIEARSDRERAVAQRAAILVAGRIPDPERRADHVLTFLNKARQKQRGHLLRVLGRIGGDRALETIRKATRSDDPALKDAAIRALADWPDVSAADDLLAIIQESDNLTHQVLALRGYVAIIDTADLPPGRKIRYLQDALAAVSRPEDKQLVFSGLGKVPAAESLKLMSTYLNDEDLQTEAAFAVVNIAQGLSGPEVAMGLIGTLVNPEVGAQIQRYLTEIAAESGYRWIPEGFIPLFNSLDLTGWKGSLDGTVSDSLLNACWQVVEGELFADSLGVGLVTAEDYGDFELLVDWRIGPGGQSGILLRGGPEVQIRDADEYPGGSGGISGSPRGVVKPLVRADNPVGEWNTFRINVVGQTVTVYLNDILVVNGARLGGPTDATGPIGLNARDTSLSLRNIFIREIPRPRPLATRRLFNGRDLAGWQQVGGVEGAWQVADGILYTEGEGGGWLSTTEEYADFTLDLEFRLPAGGNSGVFLRAPHEGDPAYAGLEIQVLDDYADKYADLKPWQYTGSIYGVQAPSSRASRRAGRWQRMVIICRGPQVQITLNDKQIVDANLIDYMYLEKSHPGLKRRRGYIGLQNHSTRVDYRNVRIEELILTSLPLLRNSSFP
ncbi:MAG: DUF1080 domain-containing protein [Fidelibacterota bacterium]|nr:MAG: DUF1080 domain-containing protein [Candidatus Neomarinimicrobiota bacterium]